MRLYTQDGGEGERRSRTDGRCDHSGVSIATTSSGEGTCPSKRPREANSIIDLMSDLALATYSRTNKNNGRLLDTNKIIELILAPEKLRKTTVKYANK